MIKQIFLILVIMIFNACGGGSSNKKIESQNIENNDANNTIEDIDKRVGYYRDSAITGVDYQCGKWSGKTDQFGRFDFQSGKGCVFSLVGITLKVVSAEDLLTKPIVMEENKNVARMLQILDNDGDPSTNLYISEAVTDELKKANLKKIPSTEEEFKNLYNIAKLAKGYNGKLKTQEEANNHLNEQTIDKTPPTITLKGSSNIKIKFANTYKELGATASDDVDGDISDNIVITGNVDTNKAGNYTIYYDVEDNSHNKATQKKRVITVLPKPDTTPPTITLNGDTNITIQMYKDYIEAGATASDDVDGDISDHIKVSGSVDTDKMGNYVITYTVSDKAGNSTTVKREVKVIEYDNIQKDKIVDRHNYYRSLVFDGHELSWDDELAKHAQEWADYLAEHYNKDNSWPSPHASSFEKDLHTYDDAYEGENIAWHSNQGIPFVAPEPIDEGTTSSLFTVDDWAAERSFYDYETNSQKAGWEHKKIGHYTQLVWENTEKVGCARAKSKTDLKGEWFVCRYKEPGNVIINGVKQKPYAIGDENPLPSTSDSKELIWNDEEPKKLNYDDAVKYCRSLDVDGSKNWRLPEITELLTLPNYKASVGENMKSLVLDHIKENNYWSNTKAGSTAWNANLTSSKVDKYEFISYRSTTSKLYNVICVRGGRMPEKNRFSRKNGIVYDKLTNLQWQDKYSDDKIDIQMASEASSYCESLNIDNVSGWRTPNVQELLSIVNIETNRGKYFDIFQVRGEYELTYTYTNDTTRGSAHQNHWLIGISDQNTNFEVYHHVCPIGMDTRANIKCVREDGDAMMSSSN
jgi:hypothetical protein